MVEKRKTAEEVALIAQEKAEKANCAKTEFLARVSHELRTPMNAVMGFGQLLELDSEKNLSERQKENVENILMEGDHLLNLINEILDISAIENSKIKLLRENLTLNPLMDFLISSISPLAQKRGITIKNRIPFHQKFSFYADSFRFNQVMMNILGSSIKYNKENGFVYVSCDEDEKNLYIYSRHWSWNTI